jgi:hypothetical protein
MEVIAGVGDELWFAGWLGAAVYRHDPKGDWTLVKEFGYPDYPGKSHSSSHMGNGRVVEEPLGGWVNWVASDKDGKPLLLGCDGLVYRWDGKGDSLTCQPLEIDNSLVEKAEALEETKQPTGEQFREFGEILALKKLPREKMEELMSTGKAKFKTENWTPRERMAWMIEALKTAVEAETRHPTATHPEASGAP